MHGKFIHGMIMIKKIKMIAIIIIIIIIIIIVIIIMIIIFNEGNPPSVELLRS